MNLRPPLAVPRALRDPWLAASLAGLLGLLGLIAVFGRDAGVTWDEGFQFQYGERVLAWFRSGFQDRSALEYLDLYLYGGLFDAPAQWIVSWSPLDPYETRHVLSALTALAAIYGTWLLAAAVGGSRAGFFAAATLALTPAWIGHGLFNPKDIPFATGSVFVTLAAQRIVVGEGPIRIREVVWAGVALGFALGVRPGGFFLVSYPIVAIGVRTVQAGKPASIVSSAASVLPRLFLMSVITWVIMLSAWPWAQLDPVSRPFEAIYAASHFNWAGATLFEGQRVASTELPSRYLPVWFGITLPEIYWVAALAGAVSLVLRRRARGPRALALGLITFSLLLPLTAALVMHPTLYDAHRHFLFLFPPLAALGGISIATFSSDARIWKSVRMTALGVWLFAALLVAIEIVQLHPYEYVYFNRTVGGLRGAVGRYETDYWGASYREGLRWVVKHVQQSRPLSLAACDGSSAGRLFYYVQHWPEAAGRFTVIDDPTRADLFLAVTRLDCHRRVPGEVLHVIERQAAPLLYVIHPTH
jgi:hypothetical protein